MADAVRIGVIGAGSISAGHLKACRDTEGVRALALADVDEANARQRAEEFDVPHIYTDYRELIARDDIDAVIVSVPNFLHAPVSIAALKAGKHVLCEKPMALNAAEAEEMLATAKAADRVLMIGLNRRYTPGIANLRRWIADGRLGRVYFVETGWCRRAGIPGWGSWFTQRDRSGGGPVIDIGVHMLDVAWYLAGSPTPRAVSAVTFSELGPKRVGIGRWGRQNAGGRYDVEDFASAIFRFDGGLAIHVQVSWAAHMQERVWLNVLGDEAGAEVRNAGVRLLREEDGSTIEEEPELSAWPESRGRIPHFVDCIREGRQPISNGEEGLVLQRMLDALYRSARESREVEI